MAIADNTKKTGWKRSGEHGTSTRNKARAEEAKKKKEANLSVGRQGAISLAKNVLNPVTNKLNLRPDQSIIFDDWFDNPDNFIMTLACGRRYGKTTLLATICATEAASNPNSLIWWVTPNYGPGLTPKSTIDHILLAWGATEQRLIRKHWTELKNGTQIHFNSWWQAENLLGAGPNVIFVDEARLMEATDFEVVFFPMILASEGRFMMASSMGGPRGFFYRSFINGMEGDNKKKHYKSYSRISEDNPLNDKDRMEMFRLEAGNAFERECHNRPMDIGDEGYLFGDEILSGATGEIKQTPERLDKPIVMGIDSAGAIGQSGWVILRGDEVVASGADRYGDILTTADGMMQFVRKYDPEAVGIDGTSVGGNNFETVMRSELDKDDRHNVPVFSYPFNMFPDDTDRYGDWRTERLFRIKEKLASCDLMFNEEKNRKLYQQFQGVQVTQNDKGIWRCSSKRKSKGSQEDIIDGLIVGLEAQEMWGYQRNRKATDAEGLGKRRRRDGKRKGYIY